MNKDIKDTVRPCPYNKKCGGCSLQNLSYNDQLRHKQVKLIRLLGVFGHVEEIIGMENPTHYRNKVQAVFTVRNGKLVSGIYQSSTGSIVPVESCLIEDEVADSIISTLCRLFTSFKIKPYDRLSGRGFLRHVLIKRGFKSGQVMVVIVTKEGDFPSRRSFINALLNRHPEITTIVRSVNENKDGLFLGEDNEILFGGGYIEEELCGMTFRISPSSFYQVNPTQTEKLYNKAIKLAGLTGEETLIDAYCGTGTIGLIMSRAVKKVTGIELNKNAVNDAFANARLNNVHNISFICGDAGKFMHEATKNRESVDVVVTDPPRAGCSRQFLQSLVALAPKKVVYISCNPETLARDLFYLRRKGYHIEVIQPVDMFPYTGHVETVVLLKRNEEQA